MNNHSLTLSIDLHYFMNDGQRHEMDATIHNKCEANILQALNHLGDLFDEDIQIDVSALEQGGLVDKFRIAVKSQTFKNLLLLLSGALINHFIGVSPALDESQVQLNRAEIVKKIKEGNFTQEEIRYVIQGDPDILTSKNKYFTELVKEPHVASVACCSYEGKTPENKLVEASVNRVDFPRQIVIGYTNCDTNIYSGTSVLVVSPVLLQGSQAKWKGLFNNEEIHFKITDREFLKQVYAQEVGFTSGTSINCDLKITKRTVYDAMGKLQKQSSECEISNITSWDDGKQVLHETKHYKRKKIEDSQLSLFNDSDFE